MIKLFNLFFLIILNFIIFAAILNSADNNTLELQLKKMKQNLDEKKGKKQEIFKQILDNEKKKNRLRQEENKILKIITELDKNITDISNNIDEIRIKLDITKVNIKLLEDEIRTKNIQLSEREKILAKRLKQIFKQRMKYGEITNLLILFETKDLSNSIKQLRFMYEIASFDNNLINNVKTEKSLIEEKKIQLKEEQKIFEDNNRKLQMQFDELTRKKLEKQKFLKGINSDKEKTLQLIKELRNQDLLLTKVLEELKKSIKETAEQIELNKTKFEKRKGSLPYPVKKGVISRNFGTNKLDKFDSIKVINNGLDFAIKEKSDVLCVSSGTIIFADYFEGYGKMVIVDHGGGYRSIYSNLDEINVKVENYVAALSVIGKIQPEKNNKIFHFELREGSKALNPAEWIKK